jgi:hypothetical protein
MKQIRKKHPVQKKTTKLQTKPIDWEAVRVLAIELGAREAARRLGIKESTVLSRASRDKWNLPRRKGGATLKSADAITLRSKPGDVLIASHKELEDGTKTALMQTLHKASQAVAARKDSLDITNMAQFRDACLSAARMFGWDGKASVTYYGDDNRQVIVCDEAKRKQLIEQRQRLLEAESQGKVIELNGHKTEAAVTALPAPETHSDANVGAVDGIVAQNQSPAAQQDPIFQHMKSIGKAETWRGGQDSDQADPIRADAFPEYDI